jgi:hypothetical protein
VTYQVLGEEGRVGLLFGPDDDPAHLTPWEAASIARSLMTAATAAWPGRRCESCHQPVQWALTEARQRMILNLGDDPLGNMAARTIQGGLGVRSCKPGQPMEEGEHRVMPHWATCPNADSHRRAKPAAKKPR